MAISLRAHRARACAAAASPTTCARTARTSATSSTTSTCPWAQRGDAYDRYLVRIEEMRQSRAHRGAGDRPAARRARSSPTSRSSCCPTKHGVLTGMEQLIHQFMLVTGEMDTPKGEISSYIENPKGEHGYYMRSEGGAAPWRCKMRAPSFVEPPGAEGDPARLPDLRHRGHPRLDRLRDGGVRQVTPIPAGAPGEAARPPRRPPRRGAQPPPRRGREGGRRRRPEARRRSRRPS